MYGVFSSENKAPEPHQKLAVDGVHKLLMSADPRKNALLYHSMGKGKTLTAVQIARNITVGMAGYCDSIIVVAVPSTHKDWNRLLGKYVAVPFQVVSHQWVSRNAVQVEKINRKTLAIIDEIHLTANRGKPSTKAITKLIGRCFGSVLMSGTPFRNKEERLFVVHDWIFGDAGNYEKWLHAHCNTEPDRFAYYPKFVSFKAGDIEDYLAMIDRYPNRRIFIEKSEMKYGSTFEYLPIVNPQYRVLETYSIYGSKFKMVANSVMRKLRYLSYMKYCDLLEADLGNDTCTLHGPRKDVISLIRKYSPRNPIVYAQSSKVARLYQDAFSESLYIDGKTAKKDKDEIFGRFKQGGKMLFATDSVSTGTDGAQEATNCIVILYDTNDETSRNQLIARIAGGFRNRGDAEIVFITIA